MRLQLEQKLCDKGVMNPNLMLDPFILLYFAGPPEENEISSIAYFED